MCRSATDPGGPRRCPSHGRAKLSRASAEVAALAARAAGIARYLGPAEGFLDENGSPLAWNGVASLYQLDPPLNGYGQVIASTVDHVAAVKSCGTEWGIETFLFGVGEDSRVDGQELPGSAWGATAQQALHSAGYHNGEAAG